MPLSTVLVVMDQYGNSAKYIKVHNHRMRRNATTQHFMLCPYTRILNIGWMHNLILSLFFSSKPQNGLRLVELSESHKLIHGRSLGHLHYID